MRTSITISEPVGELAIEVMKREKLRYFSTLCEKALDEYCQKRRPAGNHDELIEVANELGVPKALLALRRAARKR